MKFPVAQKKYASVWFVVHGLLLLAFLLSLAVARPFRFNTSLFDMLPPSHSLKSVAKADAALSSATSRTVTILAYAAGLCPKNSTFLMTSVCLWMQGQRQN